MGHRVWLRKISHPEKLCVSQFHRLAEHFEKTEKDRDLNHHWQTATDWIDPVLLVKLHHLLIHPGRIIFVFFLQLLHFRRERRQLAHGAVRSVLNRPERELDDGGERQDSEAIVMQPTVQQVHEVEEKLAHQFEHPEVHDLGFIMRKLRETMVKLRAGVDFETRAITLPGLQRKARHTERSFDSEHFLVRRAINIETPAPNLIGLTTKRRHQYREKLIAHRNPFRVRNIFLVKRPRGALAHPEKSTASAKPADVDAFGLSIDAPDEPRVRGIILEVNWRGGSERNKVTRILIGFRAAILKIDIHFDNKVVFLLRRLLEEEFFADGNLLGGRALELHRRIRLGRCSEFGKPKRGRLLDERTDRRVFCRIQSDALPFFGDLPE